MVIWEGVERDGRGDGCSLRWGQLTYRCTLGLGQGMQTLGTASEAAHGARGGWGIDSRISFLSGCILHLKALVNCGANKTWQTDLLIYLGNDA